MDFVIYHDGTAVAHITAMSQKLAQEHADKTNSRPVVAVHLGAPASEMAAARYKSKLLAMPVMQRVDRIAQDSASDIMGIVRSEELANLSPEAFAAAVRIEVVMAIKTALDVSNSGLAAALRMCHQELAYMRNMEQEETRISTINHMADRIQAALVAAGFK